MLGLINAIVSSAGAIAGYVKDGLVMANRFLTPPKLTFPANGSAEFDGASDYIQLNDPFSYTNHTIAAWVYVENSGSVNVIFEARDTNDDGFRVINTSNILFYQLNAVDTTISFTKSNEWVFVTGTYNGSTAKLYVDGSVVSTTNTSQTISTTSNARIATAYDNTGYFNGNLANVAIWNRALSSDEINSVMWKGYNSLSDSEQSGLQAWYSLDDITSPAASLANMEQLAADKEATIENKAAITAAINALS
jgi:hypothetical protein